MITFKVITFSPVRFRISNTGLMHRYGFIGTAAPNRPSGLGSGKVTRRYFRKGFCRSVSSFSGGTKVGA